MSPFTLEDFVTESNRIEGLPAATALEIAAHDDFLLATVPTVGAVERFVTVVAQAPLRRRAGMDVRVGPHTPPPGGPGIERELEGLLDTVDAGGLTPWEAHHRYETLHPFMDGNGRSGRVLWLWMMGGIGNVPLGFLHTWYYQSLQATRMASPVSGGAPTPAMIAALRQIAEYDAATEAGYLDEWVEANAFHRCQAIAAEAVRAALTAQEGEGTATQEERTR